jgi:hypothetical protein
MSTRLDAQRDDEPVRLAVELDADDPLGQLRGLQAATRQVDAWQRDAIASARQRGASWSEIGEALGVSKQAAWALYNDNVRALLVATRERSGLDDEQAQRLADEQRSQPRSGSARE